ncbi:GAF domain-containing protein [Mycobacterium sp. MS1601]|uniref:GAF domain-containing protein n=1 Tax=Mycobacterium sp. MS1601 TaxID=1936029 RepID=UPI0009792A51|nr:GAF domain-containing protein [Mycobacterium sp. MS1601]AQA04532.1 GAF domain-containing protein [Mycobacterium sp. MS1601]
MGDEPTPATDTTPGLRGLSAELDAIVAKLGVKSVLVMRSQPDSMVVAATAGEASKHYTVGAAGQKAGDTERVPLYCERVVNTDAPLFVKDSRDDATFAGNEDEVEFGLHNYLGLAVHDPSGGVVGTVCVLDDAAREYRDDEVAALEALRDDVERALREDDSALGG